MTYRAVGSYYEIPQPMSGMGAMRYGGRHLMRQGWVSPAMQRAFTPQPEPPGRPVAYGSYYSFKPHQVYAGFGSIADDFSAAQVWSNVVLGGSCYTPGQQNYKLCQGYSTEDEEGEIVQTPPNQGVCGQCNYAGGQATNMIRAGLNELGYGPLAMGNVMWSEGNPGAAWAAFLADHGLTPGPGLGVSREGLILMEELLKQGAKPGPGPTQEYERKGDVIIPKVGNGNGEAGVGGMSGTTMLLIAAGVVGVAGLGYLVLKK